MHCYKVKGVPSPPPSPHRRGNWIVYNCVSPFKINKTVRIPLITKCRKKAYFLWQVGSGTEELWLFQNNVVTDLLGSCIFINVSPQAKYLHGTIKILLSALEVTGKENTGTRQVNELMSIRSERWSWRNGILLHMHLSWAMRWASKAGTLCNWIWSGEKQQLHNTFSDVSELSLRAYSLAEIKTFLASWPWSILGTERYVSVTLKRRLPVTGYMNWLLCGEEWNI